LTKSQRRNNNKLRRDLNKTLLKKRRQINKKLTLMNFSDKSKNQLGMLTLKKVLIVLATLTTPMLLKFLKR
jgi:phosphatidate phosphatase PAH1